MLFQPESVEVPKDQNTDAIIKENDFYLATLVVAGAAIVLTWGICRITKKYPGAVQAALTEPGKGETDYGIYTHQSGTDPYAGRKNLRRKMGVRFPS